MDYKPSHATAALILEERNDKLFQPKMININYKD